MTAHPQTLFTCDRCANQTHVDVNNAPLNDRMAGPMTWLMLRIGNDPSIPPSHLCELCAPEFIKFMQGERLYDRQGSGT